MAEMEKQEILQNEEIVEQEGLSPEELEALANEFTLEDLAEFDQDLSFEAEDLASLKPTYTKKEKLKTIFMNNTVFSIIKWSIAGLGLIGLVFHILALVSPDLSETLSTSVSSAIRGGLTTVSNLLPVSLFEILVVVVLAGILGYAGFLIYKTIVAKKDGVKIAGYWVQFGYVLVAIFGFGYLLFSLCYGVTTNRPMVYKTMLGEEYKPNLFTEDRLDGSMIYYTDKINEVAVDGLSNLYYTSSGHSRYASTGRSTQEIAEAVNACFDLAADDIKGLKGGEGVVKEMLASPLYTAMGIGSMYSPLTSEVLINTDYPEMIVPMQIARAIAKQRGITNDSDASFVAFLICTKYADQLADLGEDYNTDFLKYSAYMDAYLEVGNIVYRISKDMHLYCSTALKESAKKDVVAFVKDLDVLYGNTSSLKFTAADKKTSTEGYKALAKLLYCDFTDKIEDGKIGLTYDSAQNPVPVKNSKYTYLRYLVANFTQDYNDNWGEAVEDTYLHYNPQAK